MKKIFVFTLMLFLTYNFEIFAQKDNDFEIIKQIKTTSVKDQGSSGTCWSFATVSFLETEYLRENNEEIDLSEMFIVYNAYITKAKYYLLLHGKENFSQGGQAHDVIDILNTNGIILEDDYSGLINNAKAHNHYKLEAGLKNYLDSIIETNKIPSDAMKVVEQKIISYLGATPTQVNYKSINYTTKEFNEKVLNLNPDDYIEITSYSHHDYYTTFDLEIPDNWSHNKYYNVPIEDLISIIDNSVNLGYSVCWDGDVSESKFNHAKSKAVLTDADKTGITTNGIEKYRLITFENYETTDDHLMHLTGIAKNKDGEIYYQIKNSWGAKSNKSDGFLYMSKDFVELKTVAILVNKNSIPENIKTKLGL